MLPVEVDIEESEPSNGRSQTTFEDIYLSGWNMSITVDFSAALTLKKSKLHYLAAESYPKSYLTLLTPWLKIEYRTNAM